MFREYKDPTIENQQLLRWIICALIACGVVLRLLFLGRNGLTFEEINYFSLCTGGPIHTFSWHSVLAIYQTPLFYLIGRCWLQDTDSLVWIRLLPALFGILTLPLVYLTSRHFMSRIGSIACLAFVTLSPYHIYISQRFFPHSQLIFFLILHFYCFFQLSRRGANRYWLACFVASAIFCSTTNSYMLILCVSQLIYIRLLPSKKNYFLIKYWWRCWGIVLLISLMVFVLVINYLECLTSFELVHDSLRPLWHVFLMIFVVPYTIYIENQWFSVLVMLLNLICLGYIIKGMMSIKINTDLNVSLQIGSPILFFCGLFLILQFILPLLVYAIAPLWYMSGLHIAGVYIPLVLLIARGIIQIHSRLWRLGSIGCILLMIVFGLLNYYYLHLIDDQYYLLSAINQNSLP